MNSIENSGRVSHSSVTRRKRPSSESRSTKDRPSSSDRSSRRETEDGQEGVTKTDNDFVDYKKKEDNLNMKTIEYSKSESNLASFNERQQKPDTDNKQMMKELMAYIFNPHSKPVKHSKKQLRPEGLY